MKDVLDILSAALANEQLTMSPRDGAAMLARAAITIESGATPPWEVKSNLVGVDGGPNPAESRRRQVVAYLAPPVERRQTPEGRSVTVLRVNGPIVNDAMSAFWMGGVFSESMSAVMNELAREGESGTNRSPVAVVWNSPGGSSRCVSDLVTGMKRLAAARPVVSIASCMCSLAYEVGCFARSVVATPQSLVGSIGSIITIRSYAAALKDAGIEVRNFASGKFKTLGDPTQPIDDDTVAYFSAFVERAAMEFFKDVSSQRKLSVDAIKAMEARVYNGEEAVKMGLCDRCVDDVNGFLDSFATAPAGAGPGGLGRPGSETSSQRKSPMFNNVDELRAAYGPLVEQIEKKAKESVTEGSASPTDLRSAFPGDAYAAFREACIVGGLTMSAARIKFAESQSERITKLEGEKTELSTKLAALATSDDLRAAANPLKAPKLTTTQGADGKELPEGVRAFATAFQTKLAAKASFEDAMKHAISTQGQHHQAWIAAGSPGLPDMNQMALQH